jgi:predicted RecB family endonuclease
MDSRKDDDVGDGVAIPADVVDSQPAQGNHDDSGQDDSGGQSPQVHGIDGVQEQHSLNMDGEGGGELDAAGSDGEGQDAIDAHGDQAANMLSNEQLEDSNELIGADVNQTGLNQGEDAAEALQQEVNELKIELLSSQRNLDEAHERELDLQRQLHELTNQRTAEARTFAEKTARLEHRLADLQHQLQESSRQQQQSPSSDLRIRVAEVQELKARIKQYEIKLASSEEISNIRKEADMDRIKTDASWQHRMLSDQVKHYAAQVHVHSYFLLIFFISRFPVLLRASVKGS